MSSDPAHAAEKVQTGAGTADLDLSVAHCLAALHRLAGAHWLPAAQCLPAADWQHAAHHLPAANCLPPANWLPHQHSSSLLPCQAEAAQCLATSLPQASDSDCQAHDACSQPLTH